MALLEIADLCTHFHLRSGVVRAVNGLSFDIQPNETLAIVGESGSGKSVAAMSILRLLATPPALITGTIRFGGVDLLSLPEWRMRGLRGNDISMIFQEPMTSLNPVLSVGWQISETLRLHAGMSAAAARQRAIELLELVGIPSASRRIDEYPHQFSGGMRQRVMISMALACSPKLLIADEPTTALDVTIQAQIMVLLRRLKKQFASSIMLITHDFGLVAEMADRVIVMYAGRAVEQASVGALFRSPKHPYTRGLIKAVPTLGASPTGKQRTPLPEIRGNVPSLREAIVGCAFAPRCDSATAICFERAPETEEKSEGHFVECHHVHAAPELERVRKPMNNPLLQIQGLKKHYPLSKDWLPGSEIRRVHAVDGVDMTVHRGETVALVGESGCGKSTIGRVILGLTPVTEGEILFDGTRIDNLKPEKFRQMRHRIQVIFQDPFSSLNPRRKIRDIIGEPLVNFGLARSRAEISEQVGDLLDRVRLPRDAASRYPHEFSGGQRQRIGIARALAPKPDLIVCDEAVSALDLSVKAQIINLLSELQQKFGLSMLFISHDLAIVEHLSDRVAVMYLGKIAEIGSRDEVFAQPTHPYTQALLNAVPIADPFGQRERIVLGGDIPSPINPEPGCRFKSRCPYVFDRCLREEPVLRLRPQGQLSACHLDELPPRVN